MIHAAALPHRAGVCTSGPAAPLCSPVQVSAAALLILARWCTPDLPLYGDDHDRGDFAP